MHEFSRTERGFLLLLLTSFLIGCAVTWYRQSRGDETMARWQVQHQETARLLNAVDSLRRAPAIGPADTAAPLGLLESKRRLIARININSATAEELAALERIGPAMAARIIAYRQEHGPFRTIEQLQEVKGIGPKTFVRIRERIRIE